ncbi:MAG: hypothetical protein ABIS68_02960, partial [Casimicrobiaceae bacterium]
VLQTFNIGGDTSLQYGSPYPMLDTIDGALLPAAVAYALLNAKRAGFVISLIALTSALVAGGVFTIDAPFWPRLIVVLPFLALLLAALLDAIWQLLHRAAMPPTLRVLLAVGFLIVIARENYQWYFTQFATQIRADILAAPMDVGNYLRRVDGYPAVYGITDGKELYASHEGIRFLAPRAQICDVLEGISTENCESSVTLPSEQIFLLMPGRESLLESLKRTYPGGAVRKLWSYDNDLKIIAYRVPL